MYKRRKELCFTTEDLMRMHWNRQGQVALAWAREIIKRMLKAGVIEAYKPDPPTNPAEKFDRRRRLYRFTEEKLKQWNLWDPTN